MTPLALQLMHDLTTPGQFKIADMSNVAPFDQYDQSYWGTRRDFWDAVTEYKFIDLTAVTELCESIAATMKETYEKHDHWGKRLAFLPAEKTWLELKRRGHSGARTVQLLNGYGSCIESASNWILTHFPHRGWCMVKPNSRMPLTHSTERPLKIDYDYESRWSFLKKGEAIQDEFLTYAALALINTPRVIGQKTHFPHQRLERERLKAMGITGKFPLRAWTEILLRVAMPDDRTGQPSEEHHLTGEKCQHYCRTFLRVRLGQLEYVEGHWRGNPALGMKRSKYLVEP